VIAARPGTRASSDAGALTGDVGADVGAAEGAGDGVAASDAGGLEVASIDIELCGFPHEAMMNMQTVMARCSRIGNLRSTGSTAPRSRR